jgi:glycine/D-amino acid oxidase-like deaminating enzyme
MTQRPGESPHGGQLMIGGTFSIASNNGLDEIGVWDDSVTDLIAEAHLLGILPTVFGSKGWGEDADSGRLIQAWSGIVGLTSDMLPYVGPLDPRNTDRTINSRVRSAHGEFVVGGYGGDGMVFAWLSGVAVGLMALGIDQEDIPMSPGIPAGPVASWLPASFNPAFDRIKNSSMLDAAAYL